MERLEINRLAEDKNFYDRIIGQILEELGELSRTFDKDMVRWGHGRAWEERLSKFKTGEKLGQNEPVVREIAIKIAQKSGLSDTELQYLLNSLFSQPVYKKRPEDD